ncbi:MAG TPA: pyridoxal phosphate-dependent aminotransferase family protein [Candidatus Eisenbacteria bacterium]|nr:pyridoxal phosphate-dependent aminotransferase family protein [Candidatus Eisenbacteria bacterium]
MDPATEVRVGIERPETRYAPGVVEDPFDGFFDEHPRWDAPEGGLLDLLPARRWFDVVGWGVRTRLYAYQQVMKRLDGAHVSLNGRRLVMLSSYDYLDLIGHPEIDGAAVAAIGTHGTGTGGVRLLTGTCSLHRELEAAIAAFKGTEAAIALNSGFAANVGIISALFGPRDVVIADEAIHRSLIEGCALTRVPVRTFRHNDMASLRAALEATAGIRRRLIAVEGVYSMDGDVCPLPEVVALKEEHGAFLLVDEAHTLGLLGATGRGLHEHFGLPSSCVEIWTGSLSKTVPASGGYAAGSRELAIYLQHGVAPFMFSAALAPASAAAARAALGVIPRETDRLERVRRNAEALRRGLAAQGWNVGRSTTAVVPVIVGGDVEVYTLARRLLDEGVFTTAIVPPAVPRGGARLRLCVTAALTERDLEEALRAFRAVRS